MDKEFASEKEEIDYWFQLNQVLKVKLEKLEKENKELKVAAKNLIRLFDEAEENDIYPADVNFWAQDELKAIKIILQG